MTTLHDIAAAFDDPALFGEHFAAPGWAAWRAFVRALTGAPLDADQLAIFQECTGRSTAPTEAFTEAALVVGRRGGKSRVLAFIAAALATLRDYGPYLAAGEVATVMVLAQTTKQARTIFRFVAGFLKSVPALAAMIVREDTETIELNNRVVIEIASASFRSTRGYTLAAVLCDEIAFWRDDTSANPDTEILRALRPALGTIPGSMMLLASSPYAKGGELYTTYRRYYGRDDGEVLVWQAPTLRMHPSKHLERARERDMEADPEAARAEWDAQFRDDLADFITREAIDAITAWGRKELPPVEGISYVAFADPSGGSNDSFTLAIGHQQGDLGVLDAVLEIRPPFDPDAAVADCAAALKRYGVSRVVGDHYAGLWPVARFAAHGVAFEQSARGKSDIYSDFLPLANAGRIELLDIPRLASQFVGLQRRTGRSGKDSIAEPKGAHDDLCNAVAGVLVGLDLDRRPALVRERDLLVDNAPADLRHVLGAFGTVWLSLDGMAAWCVFAYCGERLPLIVADFDALPWSAAVLPAVACRLDALCEEARERDLGRAVHAILWVPDQIIGEAHEAMRAAFAARFERFDFRHRNIVVDPIDAELLADPARLVLGASAAVSGGHVKLAAAAAERAATKPLLGTLAVRPGETIDGSPLRVAALLGIAMSGAAPSPQQGAARIAFAA